MDRKPSGRCREGINGVICLKFGAVIAWVNPCGGLSHFLKILIFGPWRPGPGP